MITPPAASIGKANEKENKGGQFKMGYRPDIDGMRGIAVLAVIINHFNEEILPGGYLGVDIFFVISGFVILASLASRQTTSFKALFLDFYARRVRRILPALVFYVVIVGILLCLLMPDPGPTLGIGVRALFGFSNIQLYNQSAQYFSESVKLNPYTHTWSLGVEEQFYLVFPFLIGFSGFHRSSTHGRRNLAAAIGLLAGASLGLFIYLYPRNQPAAYFLMPSRFWEMGAGSLLFLAWMGWEKKSRPIFPWLTMLALGALIVAFFLPLSMAVPATLTAVLATGVILLTASESSKINRLLGHSFFVKAGLLSYSMYLWHWGVLALSRLSIGVTRWTIPLQLILILLLSLLSYHFIEAPLRRAHWSSKNSLTIAKGIAILISASLVLTILSRMLADRLYLAKYKGDDFTYVQKTMACELMSLNRDKTHWRKCLLRSSMRPHIFVLGDSHASNLVPSLKAAASKLGFADVRYLTNAIPHRFHIEETIPAAAFWNKSQEYKQLIDSLHKGDVVVFSRGMNADPIAQKSWRDQLTQLAVDVPESGSALVLVDDIPRTCSEEDFRRSFLMTAGRGCKIDRKDALAWRQPLTNVLQGFSKDNGAIIYLDPLPHLCQGDACYPSLNGRILYADNSPHFSQANPTPLASFFQAQFVRHGLTGRASHPQPM
jgi:peptidoglycan/LPS O-acetylase OafA/YrhL